MNSQPWYSGLFERVLCNMQYDRFFLLNTLPLISILQLATDCTSECLAHDFDRIGILHLRIEASGIRRSPPIPVDCPDLGADLCPVGE